MSQEVTTSQCGIPYPCFIGNIPCHLSWQEGLSCSSCWSQTLGFYPCQLNIPGPFPPLFPRIFPACPLENSYVLTQWRDIPLPFLPLPRNPPGIDEKWGFFCRYNTLPSRRTLKNSRLVSKKDDVHVCIMCLRAIMNYQVIPFGSRELLGWWEGGREGKREDF